MNIHRALSDIAEIKAQLDRTQSHRGFRSLATVLSSVLVLVMAVLLNQSIETLSPARFVDAWTLVAIVSLIVAFIEMKIRASGGHEDLIWKMHHDLGRQLVPALLAGAVLTFVFNDHRMPFFGSFGDGSEASPPPLSHLMPGMWAMIYGLGIVACVQHLPRPAWLVAAWFLIGGSACILLESPSLRHLNQQMAILFAGGQLALGAVLFWKLERHDE